MKTKEPSKPTKKSDKRSVKDLPARNDRDVRGGNILKDQHEVAATVIRNMG